MRGLIFLLLALFSVPATAQYLVAPVNTAADYVEPGQDAPGYQAWVAAAPYRLGQVQIFNDYLVAAGVAGIVPTWQLLRTASEWRRCGQSAFEVPPPDYWGHLVNTLRFARDHVVPAVGAIEAVSVYRNAELNSCAGGAPASAHRFNFAVDLVPRFPFPRSELMRRLCTVHAKDGRQFDVGFGFYKGLRFHIDDNGYRIWGVSKEEGGWPCEAALLRREEARLTPRDPLSALP